MKTKFLTLIILGVFTSCIFQSCTDTICSNYANEPPSDLEVQLVHKMVGGYQDNQLVKINTELIMDDAHSIWFDMETLKKFIYHIENTAKNDPDHPTLSEDLGVRIYYARYPEKNTWNTTYARDLSGFLGNSLTEQYEGLHTLVMVPTIKKEGIDLDFNPLESRTYTTGMEGISDYFPPPNSTNPTLLIIALGGSSSPTTGAQNHGSVIPPGNASGENF